MLIVSICNLNSIIRLIMIGDDIDRWWVMVILNVNENRWPYWIVQWGVLIKSREIGLQTFRDLQVLQFFADPRDQQNQLDEHPQHQKWRWW
jgi:hypothetical protein